MNKGKEIMTQIEIAKDQINKRIIHLELLKKQAMSDYYKVKPSEGVVLSANNMIWGMEIQFLKSLLVTLL